jgi:hypothetical protein
LYALRQQAELPSYYGAPFGFSNLNESLFVVMIRGHFQREEVLKRSIGVGITKYSDFEAEWVEFATKAKVDGVVMESLNSLLAQELLNKLEEWGVKRVVLCPGSRNAPLLFSAQASNEFQIYHHLDERSAAFFAMGLMYSKREPVAVFTTSGTAAAELLPACIESFYQQLPLVLVTADRPRNFRGNRSSAIDLNRWDFFSYAQTKDSSRYCGF